MQLYHESFQEEEIMNMRMKLLIVFASLLLSVAVAPTVLAGNNNDSSDMNDRFATDPADQGASGRAISKVNDGELGLHLVAKGLPADTDLEVHVVVGSGPDFGGDGFFEFHVFETTSDGNGKLKFDINGFDLGLPEAGVYRLDFVVLRAGIIGPTFDDFMLACQPAPIITFEG